MAAPEELSQQQFDTKNAQLGLEAAKFENTVLGTYLLDRADMMIEDAVKKRMAASPNDIDANMDAAVDYKIAMGFKSFIEEAVHSGMQAAHRLNGDDEDD